MDIAKSRNFLLSEIKVNNPNPIFTGIKEKGDPYDGTGWSGTNVKIYPIKNPNIDFEGELNGDNIEIETNYSEDLDQEEAMNILTGILDNNNIPYTLKFNSDEYEDIVVFNKEYVKFKDLNEIKVNEPLIGNIQNIYNSIPDYEDVGDDEDVIWAGGKDGIRDIGPNEYKLESFKDTLISNNITLSDKEIIILYLKIFEDYIGKEYWGSDYINSLIKDYMKDDISLLKLLEIKVNDPKSNLLDFIKRNIKEIYPHLESVYDDIDMPPFDINNIEIEDKEYQIKPNMELPIDFEYVVIYIYDNNEDDYIFYITNNKEFASHPNEYIYGTPDNGDIYTKMKFENFKPLYIF